MRLIFSGPPGAGKGTQAALLEERTKVKALSSGQLLREAIRRKDELGSKVADYVQQGALVPDELVTDLMLQRLEGMGEDESFVLDGFPRNVAQAKTLDHALDKLGQVPVDLVVDFAMSAEAVIKRLSGRRVCSQCGANYHVETAPPKAPGACDRCNKPLARRADDVPETIRKRMDVYREETAPLVRYYEMQGKLRKVPGELEIDAQYSNLLQLLEREALTR